MRRIVIFYYWLFKGKNNIGLFELIRFCFKPKVNRIAERYLKEIKEGNLDYEITFNTLADVLHWPKECAVNGIYQVTSETFDKRDWHFYQKPHTSISNGDVLLDLGAAEGLFALSVVDRCKKIILVEPNDYFTKSLEKTFRAYSDKVQILNVAVGSKDGEIAFDQNSLNGRITEAAGTTVRRKLKRVDDLLDPGTQITYLKADLEGFEQEMLIGAENTIKRDRPKIAITSYHNENEADAIVGLVKKFVPDYHYYVKGISHIGGKHVMINFWID